MGAPCKLELKNISKSFLGVHALDDVNLAIEEGSVHVIVGENGAGKSTLMKIINGIYAPDRGKMLLDGREIVLHNPLEAKRYGISMIFQELSYVPDITIAENIFLGREPLTRVKYLIDWRQMFAQTEALLKAEELPFGPRTKMRELTVSEIQMIEIIKAISYDSKVIIMDEPTSAITKKEVNKLFDKIRGLKRKGATILYISHKMDEIFQIADTITVLRDGKLVDTRPAKDLDIDTVISMMVGRSISHVFPKENVLIGEKIFSVENLRSKNVFEDISLDVRKGEILGISGLMGAGRTEVARAIFGLDAYDGGTISIDGREIRRATIKKSIENGIAMISEDRKRYGLIAVRSVKENISLSSLKLVTKLLFINKKKEYANVMAMVDKLSVKTPTINAVVGSLSGGNQQKVVLAKGLLSNPKVLILDEPTRGIDVGAKLEIYRLIGKLAKEGIAIIFISSELPELLGICDRLIVMRKGRVAGHLPMEGITQEKVMKLATGG